MLSSTALPVGGEDADVFTASKSISTHHPPQTAAALWGLPLAADNTVNKHDLHQRTMNLWCRAN